MPKPKTVYDPMTGRPRHPRQAYFHDRYFVVSNEPVERQLGFSEHRLARADGNVEKLSIKGRRIA